MQTATDTPAETEAKIVVRPRQQWLRDALAGRTFGAVDGLNYRVDDMGQAMVAADSGQDRHPDWELVSGTPQTKEVDPASGAAVLTRGPLRWVRHRSQNLCGMEVSGPAPMAFRAFFDVNNRAAVPDNSGFGSHPDFIWGDYLSADETLAETERRRRLLAASPQTAAGAPMDPDMERSRVAREVAASIQQGMVPNLGYLSGARDPNSTGVPGVIDPTTVSGRRTDPNSTGVFHRPVQAPDVSVGPTGGMKDPNATGVPGVIGPAFTPLPPAAMRVEEELRRRMATELEAQDLARRQVTAVLTGQSPPVSTVSGAPPMAPPMAPQPPPAPQPPDAPPLPVSAAPMPAAVSTPPVPAAEPPAPVAPPPVSQLPGITEHAAGPPPAAPPAQAAPPAPKISGQERRNRDRRAARAEARRLAGMGNEEN